MKKGVEKDKKAKNRNITPTLDGKTLASQGTSRKMSVVGGATSGARVEGGKKWGDVACKGAHGRGNGGCRMCDDRSCVSNGNDYGDVVVGGVRESDHRNGLVRFCRGRSCEGTGWDQW